MSIRQLIGQFDKIAVRIPEIDGQQGAGCADAADRTLKDLNPDVAQMPDGLFKGRSAEKAEIGAARLRGGRMGLKLLSCRMEFDFLPAEPEGKPSVVVDDLLHAQGPGVEKDSGQDIVYRQYQMIKTVELHSFGIYFACGPAEGRGPGYFVTYREASAKKVISAYPAWILPECLTPAVV
jgi:hypothetical protein